MKLILNRATSNLRTVFSIAGYNFGYDSELHPIPVDVDPVVAEALLRMEGTQHTCCPKDDLPFLFLAVD